MTACERVERIRLTLSLTMHCIASRSSCCAHYWPPLHRHAHVNCSRHYPNTLQSIHRFILPQSCLTSTPLTMRTTALTFVLVATVLSFFIPSTSAATRTPWQDIVVLDCSQNLHFLPSHPLFRTSLTASAATQLYTYVVNTIRSRVSCNCPSLSSAELTQSFNTDFGALLRAVESGVDNTTSRSRCGIKASMGPIRCPTRTAARQQLHIRAVGSRQPVSPAGSRTQL